MFYIWSTLGSMTSTSKCWLMGVSPNDLSIHDVMCMLIGTTYLKFPMRGDWTRDHLVRIKLGYYAFNIEESGPHGNENSIGKCVSNNKAWIKQRLYWIPFGQAHRGETQYFKLFWDEWFLVAACLFTKRSFHFTEVCSFLKKILQERNHFVPGRQQQQLSKQKSLR